MNIYSKDEKMASDNKEAEDILISAEELLEYSLGELFATLRHLRKEPVEGAKTVAQAVKDLRQALHWVMEERGRLEKQRKTLSERNLGGTELDLGAARDEIERRLACLRAAQSG